MDEISTFSDDNEDDNDVFDDDDKDEDWQPEKKRLKEGCVCMIHCSKAPGKIKKLDSMEKWTEIVTAARALDDEKILIIAADTEPGTYPSNFWYHKNCRCTFLLKSGRNMRKGSKSVEESLMSPESFRRSRREKNSNILLPKDCIFCQKIHLYKKGNKKIKATKIGSKAAKDKIELFQKEKKDPHIEHLLNNYDIVASEAHYHHACYNDFTRDGSRHEKAENNRCGEVNDDTLKIEEDLLLVLKDNYIQKKKSLTMEECFELYKSKLPKDLESGRLKYIRKRLKNRIQTEFDDLIIIHTMSNGKLLLIPRTIDLVTMAEQNYQFVEKERKNSILSNQSKSIVNVGKLIRQSFMDNKPSFSWPPKISELKIEEMTMSDSCSLFWKTVFDKSEKKEFNIKESSILQDLSYVVTHTPSAKHFLLSILVKSLSGNVELITTLNRLGNGISHSALLEVMTAAAMQKINEVEKDFIVLPEETQIGESTTLVYDNIDRLEETLSGSGTSHRVNGIAVQRGFIGPLPEKKRVSIPKTKRRSLQTEEQFITPYNTGRKPPPPYLKGLVIRYSKYTSEFKLSKQDVLWVLTRYIHRKSQCIPSWTGFNILIRGDNLVIKDNVGYLPTINHPATSMATIHEMLCQAITIKDQIGIKDIVLVCDQAIYAKAIEVAWSEQSKFESVIIRLGAFHTICTFLAVLGKRFGDAGLRDIAIESGVIAEGSINGVFNGKQYNRAVRFHKLLYESLLRIMWEKFITQLKNSDESYSKNLDEIIEMLLNNPNKDKLKELLQDKTFGNIFESFDAYFMKLTTENGSMSKFWMSYIMMVKTLLDIVRASRDGDFLLHLVSVEAMIPWCFAYDRTNYSRYLPWYVESMKELKTSNPDVWNYLCNRGFSVQMSSTNTFGRIPMDQTIEETVNKDTQTTGGTKGFSLNKNAVSRYYISSDFKRSCLRQIRQSLNTRREKCGHPDLKAGRMRRDETDVQQITDLFQTVWKNPFDDDELSNLATAVQAPSEVKSDLIDAHNKGIEAYNTFVEERFIQKTKKFEERIPKMKLKTFSVMNKKKLKVGGKEIELKSDRNLFAKMAVIAQTRKLDMREVLQLELGPHSYALGTNDGMLRKTDKSTVGKDLEPLGISTFDSEKSSACIIDAMSFVQKFQSNHKTFAEISKSLFHRFLNEGKNYERIDIIFDTYKSISIKNPERKKRGEGEAPTFTDILPGQKITQWTRFLKSSRNKSALIEFFIREWHNQEYLQELGEKKLYVAFEKHCKLLTNSGVVDVDELGCMHEEADTRLILHANHASSAGFENVVIVADDTDVLMIALSHVKEMNANVFQKRGNRNRTRLVNVSQINLSMGTVADALLGVYAFTGCDSVSAFAGKGKLPAVKLMKKNERYLKLFKRLGQELIVSDDDVCLIQEFVCDLYGGEKLGVKTVSELRYLLFCAKGAALSSHQLPPSIGCLKKHILRANYQAYIWRNSLEKMLMLPSPDGFGWKIIDGDLEIDWTDDKPAPDSVIEMLACKCKKPCAESACDCHQNRLPCTDVCSCKCENKYENEDEENEESDDETDDEYDDYDDEDVDDSD